MVDCNSQHLCNRFHRLHINCCYLVLVPEAQMLNPFIGGTIWRKLYYVRVKYLCGCKADSFVGSFCVSLFQKKGECHDYYQVPGTVVFAFAGPTSQSETPLVEYETEILFLIRWSHFVEGNCFRNLSPLQWRPAPPFKCIGLVQFPIAKIQVPKNAGPMILSRRRYVRAVDQHDDEFYFIIDHCKDLV